jgi:hypothetical protein
MHTTRGSAHKSGRRLHSALSLAVQEETILYARGWTESRLDQLGVRPDELQRLIAAIAQQLKLAIDPSNSGKITTLTIRLFSANAEDHSGPGLGFFIINKPQRASKGILEIYIYQES